PGHVPRLAPRPGALLARGVGVPGAAAGTDARGGAPSDPCVDRQRSPADDRPRPAPWLESVRADEGPSGARLRLRDLRAGRPDHAPPLRPELAEPRRRVDHAVQRRLPAVNGRAALRADRTRLGVVLRGFFSRAAERRDWGLDFSLDRSEPRRSNLAPARDAELP